MSFMHILLGINFKEFHWSYSWFRYINWIFWAGVPTLPNSENIPETLLNYWFVVEEVTVIIQHYINDNIWGCMRSTVIFCQFFHIHIYIDGSVQDYSNSIANALELLQSCTKPSIYTYMHIYIHTYIYIIYIYMESWVFVSTITVCCAVYDVYIAGTLWTEGRIRLFAHSHSLSHYHHYSDLSVGIELIKS